MVLRFIKSIFNNDNAGNKSQPVATTSSVSDNQLDKKIKYGVIVGSTRKNSYSKTLANGIVAGLPADAEVTFIEIGNLPLYNQDYDANSPAEYIAFREAVAAQDAIIFTTPEHNRSVSAALKNALDVASRPWGQSVWAGKPAVIASQSLSELSGVLAHNVLAKSLVLLDMPTLGQPEVYIANSAELLGETGEVANAETAEFLKSVGQQFDVFAKKLI